MKILYITQWFSTPAQPGLSRAYQFSKKWVDSGHKVRVVTGLLDHLSYIRFKSNERNFIRRENVEGIDVVRVPALTLKKQGILQRAVYSTSYALLGSLVSLCGPKPDLVYASSPYSIIGWMGLKAAKIFGVPFVYEMRDLWPDRLQSAGYIKDSHIAERLRRMEEKYRKQADALVVVTKGDKKRLVEEGLLEHKIHVVPHGVDNWMTRQKSFRSKKTNGRFECVYAGSFGRLNRLHDVLDVARFLKGDNRFKFTLFGDGDLASSLKKKKQILNLNNIKIEPAKSKKEVFLALQKADACLLVSGEHSYYSHWLPNKIFDYLASGTPVLAAARGEMAELIKLAGGLVVEPGNPKNLLVALSSLANLLETQREAIGTKARDYVFARYLRSCQAAELIHVFEKVIENG